MPTPSGVNYLLKFLIVYLKLAISNDKNQKWMFILYVLCCIILAHRRFGFNGSTQLFVVAKIIIFEKKPV